MNLARLNHVLIPSTKEGRDRFRQSRWARILVGPLARAWLSLTDEGRGLLALSMLASGVGLDVSRGQNHLLWALCFSLLAAALAVRPALRLRGVRIEVEGPVRVHVGADAHFAVRVSNEGSEQHAGLRIQLPFLPWDGSWRGAERRVVELSPGQRVTAQATARFVERGPHHIDPFGVAALVPLGLATGPLLESRGTRFVVVPRIARVARLAWPERPRHQRGGVALASRTGESAELAGLREWRDGDRLRDLHARSSARLGGPIVRQYQQEYFSRVAVVLDCEAEGAPEADFEASVSLAAGVIEHLMRSEALIDLVLAGDPRPPLTLGRSLAGLDQALDRLAEVRPGAPFDPEHAFEDVAGLVDRLSALFVVGVHWDAARARFLDRVERAGPGARALVVRGAHGPSAAPDVRLRVLSASEVGAPDAARGGLWL